MKLGDTRHISRLKGLARANQWPLQTSSGIGPDDIVVVNSFSFSFFSCQCISLHWHQYAEHHVLILAIRFVKSETEQKIKPIRKKEKKITTRLN